MARDCRHIRPASPEFGSLETELQSRPLADFSAIGCGETARALPGWRRSADRTCLHTNSLLTGNFTGNFAILRPQNRFGRGRPPVLQGLFAEFPTRVNRENISKIREF